jgi:hypothetical protein
MATATALARNVGADIRATGPDTYSEARRAVVNAFERPVPGRVRCGGPA